MVSTICHGHVWCGGVWPRCVCVCIIIVCHLCLFVALAVNVAPEITLRVKSIGCLLYAITAAHGATQRATLVISLEATFAVVFLVGRYGWL